MIEQEFIPYELALELKQLGFDEPCISVRHRDGTLLFIIHQMTSDEQSEHLPTIRNSECMWEDDDEYSYGGIQEVATPTYSQAFRWFREVHDLHCYTERFQDGEFDYTILSDLVEEEVGYGDGPFQTYEEAELACLKKLIEIVKQGGNK